jgi:TP901 family phage tail tape measure protein
MFNLTAVLNFIGANTSGVRGAINQVQNKLNAGTASAKTFSDAVALKGIQLAAYGAAGAAVIKLTESISRATSDAIRFEYELAKIAQTVNKTNAEIGGHADSIRKIAVAYGLSAPKIAETIRVLAQAGYSFKEAKASADSLAQTTLLASFESIADTTDGLIAINKQFVETMGDSARVLAVLNNVSKKYAVESSDLVEAVRKAGGVFSATGGTMEQLVAIFTTVRDTTRESAETIATGLRTIFSRLQRPKTIEYMRQFGIELTDLKGNFIGNYQAIQAIQKGVANLGITPKSTIFAGIVEEIGGIRQQARVIPLLTQANKLQRVYQDTQTAGVETALDLAKAQETLSFKIAATQQNFARFISEVSSTDSFKSLINGLLGLTNAAVNFASALKDLIPLITLMLAFKVGKSLSSRIFGGAAGERKIPGFAKGGFVPGTGSGDTVPAMLEPGEFVIRKSAAMAMGGEALHGINRYARGGPVSGDGLGSARIRKRVVSNRSLNQEFETGQKINSSDSLTFNKIAIGIPGEGRSPAEFEQFAATYLQKNKNWGGIRTSPNPNSPVDLIGGPYPIEVRSRREITSENELLDKFLRWRLDTQNSLVKNTSKGRENLNVPGQIGIVYDTGKLSEDKIKNAGIRSIKPKKKSSGGSIGLGTDTVPALLTPGEFVVNKASAQAVGYGNLNKINKYAAGGRVGVQKFASGGLVGGAIGGADAVLSIFSDVNPLLLKFGASLASASIQMNLARDLGSGIRNLFKSIEENLDEELKSRIDFNDRFKKQTDDTNTALTALTLAQEAQTSLSTPSGVIAPEIVARAANTKTNEIANRYSKEAPASGASAAQQEAAGNALSTETGALIVRIRTMGKSTEETTAAINGLLKVQSDLRGDNVASLVATRAYVDEIDLTTLSINDLRTASEKNVAIAQDYADAQVKRTNQLEKEGEVIAAGPKSISQKVKGFFKDKGPAIAEQGVAAATALTVTYFNSAAEAAGKLSTKAIEAGNAQEAYTQSLASSAASTTAEAVQSGATLGAGIGALFGPFGAAIGGAAGALIGFSGILTDLSDALGITNSTLEAKNKADLAAIAASISGLDQLTSKTLKDSSLFAKTDPQKSADILVRGTKEFMDKVSDDLKITYSTDEVQANVQSLYNSLSQEIEKLSQLPANTGKSVTELSDSSPEAASLISTFEQVGNRLNNGSEALQAFFNTIDANSGLVSRQTQAITDSINAELTRISIQDSMSRSLIALDTAISDKSDSIARLSFASGGSLQGRGTTNLTDLSTRNTQSTGFQTALTAVANLGPVFRTEVGRFQDIFAVLDSDVNALIAEYNVSDVINQSRILSKIEQKLTDAGLDKDAAAKSIKKIKDGGDPLELINDVQDAIKPGLEKLQEANLALANVFKEQVKLNEELSNAEERRLSVVIKSTQSQFKIAKQLRDIASAGLNPEDVNDNNLFAGRQGRLAATFAALSGTSLQGVGLGRGGTRDLQKITEKLRLNKLEQSSIQERLRIEQAGTPISLRLADRQAKLADEAKRFESALSSLSDTTIESEALQTKIALSQERRSKIRDAATGLAFGTGESRRSFFKTAQQSRIVAQTGGTGFIPEDDRQNVLSFLQQFKDVKLPGLGGFSGQDVINNTTKNALLSMGVPLNEVGELMARMTPIEEQALDKLKENLSLDETRNTILGQIESAISALAGGGNGGNTAASQQVAVLRANGGSIFQPRGTDTVPAMLTPGEFVMNKKAVETVGANNLAAINRGGAAYLKGGSTSTEAPDSILPPIEDVATIERQIKLVEDARTNIANARGTADEFFKEQDKSQNILSPEEQANFERYGFPGWKPEPDTLVENRKKLEELKRKGAAEVESGQGVFTTLTNSDTIGMLGGFAGGTGSFQKKGRRIKDYWLGIGDQERKDRVFEDKYGPRTDVIKNLEAEIEKEYRAWSSANAQTKFDYENQQLLNEKSKFVGPLEDSKNPKLLAFRDKILSILTENDQLAGFRSFPLDDLKMLTEVYAPPASPRLETADNYIEQARTKLKTMKEKAQLEAEQQQTNLSDQTIIDNLPIDTVNLSELVEDPLSKSQLKKRDKKQSEIQELRDRLAANQEAQKEPTKDGGIKLLQEENRLNAIIGAKQQALNKTGLVATRTKSIEDFRVLYNDMIATDNEQGAEEYLADEVADPKSTVFVKDKDGKLSKQAQLLAGEIAEAQAVRFSDNAFIRQEAGQFREKKSDELSPEALTALKAAAEAKGPDGKLTQEAIESDAKLRAYNREHPTEPQQEWNWFGDTPNARADESNNARRESQLLAIQSSIDIEQAKIDANKVRLDKGGFKTDAQKIAANRRDAASKEKIAAMGKNLAAKRNAPPPATDASGTSNFAVNEERRNKKAADSKALFEENKAAAQIRAAQKSERDYEAPAAIDPKTGKSDLFGLLQGSDEEEHKARTLAAEAEVRAIERRRDKAKANDYNIPAFERQAAAKRLQNPDGSAMTAVQEVAAEAAASEAASKAYDTRTPDSLAKAAVTTDLTNWGIPMPSKQRTYKEKLQDDIRNIEILGNAPTEGNSLADVKEKLSILQENKGEGPAGGQFYSASQARGFSQVSSEEQKAIDIENQLRNNPAKYGIPKAAIKSTGEPSYNAVQNRTRTDIIKEKLEKTKRNNARSIEPEIDQSRIPFTQEELTRLESNGKRGGDAPELTSGGVPYSVIKKRGEEHTQRLLMGSGGLSKAEQEAALNAPTGAQVADQRMELERKRIEEEKEKFKPSTPQYDMYFARGGFVSPSYYAKGGDVVPAMLTPGEFVMNKRAVDNHGSLIRRLNAGGSVQGFASGGLVGGKTAYLERWWING